MILTFASCITLSRIALTPFIIYSFVQGFWTLGFALFCVAVLTDLVDGFVARKFNQQSRFGQLLDPIADKILLTGVMFTLLTTMQLPIFFSLCVWFLIAKEFVLLIGGGLLMWQRRMFIAPTVLSRFVSLCEIMLVASLLSSKVFNVHFSIAIVYGLLVFNVFISSVLLLRYTVLITQK
ncbi:MAG: CDP-alcohol phosphatidyltransferase family protein [Candidatus Babeliales bacterium]